MSTISIKAEHVSKHFVLGAQKALGTNVSGRVRHCLNKLRSSWHSSHILPARAETFWALRDVSFEIKPGEVVGLIGRNGAGKSTLLKILSRITYPSEGCVKLFGRVGSLLEVGTGFHPELTGRDNVFLSGAFLGMTKAEIARKFDEIVDFAEIERFIDTPVKRYSSGMFVRLAFAVAAHLEPEILIMDEVLAVGDSKFQRKCLGKMEDVGRHGRTILFVSHSMPAVARLCRRVIMLDQGMIVQDGPSHEVISAYMSSDVGSSAVREWPNDSTAPQGEVARLRAVRLRSEGGEIAESIDIRLPLRVDIEFEVKEGGHVLQPFVRFMNEESICVFCVPETDPEWRKTPRPAGHYVTTASVPGNLLAEGRIFVDVALCILHGAIVQFFEANAVSCQVVDTTDGDSARGDWTGELEGALRPKLTWSTQYSPKGWESNFVLPGMLKP